MQKQRTANLLGARVTALSDGMRDSIRDELRVGGEAAAALVTIGNNPGHSLEWLSRALRITHSGVVRLADKLCAEGLVERRTADLDGRTAALFVTKRGERKQQEILAARRRVMAHALSSLSAREQQIACELIERMLAGVSRDATGDSICRLCDESSCERDRCPVTLACALVDR